MSNPEILFIRNTPITIVLKNYDIVELEENSIEKYLLHNKNIQSVLFDFTRYNEKFLDMIFTLKFKNIKIEKNIPLIGIVDKNVTRREIRDILFSGVDRIIYYPFTEKHLKSLIKEIKELYEDIFVEPLAKNFISFKINDEIKYLHTINKIISRLLYYSQLSPEEIFKLKFVLYEIGCNAIQHRKNSDLPVTISISFFKNKIIYKIKDFGVGFDKKLLNKYVNTDRVKNIDSIENAHGVGIYLANKIMDKIMYNKKGNYVILEKKI